MLFHVDVSLERRERKKERGYRRGNQLPFLSTL
jgi:hypothetical protein